jgi:hypothetical protein
MNLDFSLKKKKKSKSFLFEAVRLFWPQLSLVVTALHTFKFCCIQLFKPNTFMVG